MKRKMRGGRGNNGFLELARQAAAAARTERAARVAATRPVRKRMYRGVRQRKNRYHAAIWNTHAARSVWLGSYETPEEAAYAFDAAARVMRGHRARTNFPEPAPPAREQVAANIVLALPTPPARETAEAAALRKMAAAVAHQVSFDNWIMSGLAPAAGPQQHQQTTPAALFPHQQQRQVTPVPPFTQFFHLSDPATAAATNAATAAVNPATASMPGAYILTPQNVHQMPTTNPADTELSSTEPVVYASLFRSAAYPTHQHRELLVSQGASVFDQAFVGDNFDYPDVVAASLAARPPPVPVLTLKDLLLQLIINLPGRGDQGGAQ